MIKLFIVDDHKLFLEGISSLLNTLPQIEVCGTATNGKDAIASLKNLPVDVILLDINMPEMDGLEVLRIIQKKYANIKVVMLTMLNTPQIIQEVIEAGASGYLLKNAEKDELTACIESVFKGEIYFGEDVKNAVLNSFRSSKSTDAVVLTPREKEVLVLICNEFTSQEISEKLFLSINTIESYRKNLFDKTGAKNVAGLVKFAYENGLIK